MRRVRSDAVRPDKNAVDAASVATRAGRGPGARCAAALASLVATCAALVAFAVAPAHGADVYSHIGQFGGGEGFSPSSYGPFGLFNPNPMPQRVAVHGESEKLFVADRGNHRVQVFSPTSNGAEFAFAIPVQGPVGVAVDQDSGDLYVTHPDVAAVNEFQQVRIEGATAGTYTLSFGGDTTSALAFDASAAQVETALEALPSVGGDHLSVQVSGTGAPRVLSVSFAGALAGTDVDQIAADVSGLPAGASTTTATLIGGMPAVGMKIRKFNPDSASNPASYSEDGAFTSPAQGFGNGQIGALQSGPATSPSGGGIAVDPTNGNVVVADVGRNLVQRFASDGTFVSSFNGCSDGPSGFPGFCLGFARPAFSSVRDVAVNSQGQVIVADVSGANARVDRYLADGTLAATLSQANNPVTNAMLDPGQGDSSLTVAVNQTNDEVFVSSANGFAFGPQNARIYQFENDALATSFTAPANFQGYVSGIAVGGTSGTRLYALAGSFPTQYFFAPTPRVQAFRAIVRPTTAIDSPSDVTPTSARFTGVVNPQGNEVSWNFEYRLQGAATWQKAPTPAGQASGNLDVAVEANVTGLEPNKPYEVRLVAWIGAIDAATAPQSFDTPVAAPLAVTGTASYLTNAGATLTGGVNPRNSQTTYYFEWGTDTDYGNVTPATPADVGDGGVRVTVKDAIEGLDPGTEYHFRLVAENDLDQRTEGADRMFTTLAEAPSGLMEARAFEMVTRPDTANIPVLAAAGSTTALSEDGNRAMYSMGNADHVLPGYDAPYRFFIGARQDDGTWSVAPADTPPTVNSYSTQAAMIPLDVSRSYSEAPHGIDPDDQNDVVDIYHVRPDGTRAWVSRSRLTAPGVAQTDTARVEFVGGAPESSNMSADGRVMLFRSKRRLLEEDPNPSDPIPSTSTYRLYRWADGELDIISKRPDGSYPTGARLGNAPSNVLNAVSRDGTRIFWAVGSTIYAHTDGREPAEVGVGEYVGATTDAERVFYLDGGRLYSYEVDSGTRHDLTGDAQVRGVTAISDDGRRIYFGADAVLDAGASPTGEAPSAAGSNFYLLETAADGSAGGLRFVGRIPNGPWDQSAVRAASISSGGDFLAFGTTTPLTGQPTGGYQQAFVYDVAAHSLVCVSCPADGSMPATGDVNGAVTQGGTDSGSPGGARWPRRLVAASGTFVFATKSALVDGDENAVRDVYEYRNGAIRLVSLGASTGGPATVGGISIDGRTVIFTTEAALDPRDRDPGSAKLYAARIGGGVAVPEPPAPKCVGDACQPASSGDSRGTDPPATAALRGSGNARSEASASFCLSLAKVVRQRSSVARKQAALAARLSRRARRAEGARRTVLVIRVRQARRRAASAKRQANRARLQVKSCRRAAR